MAKAPARAGTQEANSRAGLFGELLRSPSVLAELVRFAAVGIPTSLLDFAVLDLGLWILGTHTPALILANSLAYLTSMVASYIGNRNFTFRFHGTPGAQGAGSLHPSLFTSRFWPYAAVSLSGYFIESATLVLIWGVFHSFGLAHGVVAADAARILAAVPALAWTFLLYRSVVFAPELGPTAAGHRRLYLPRGVRWLMARYPLVPLVGLLLLGLALRLPFLLSLPLSPAEWQAAHAADAWVSGQGVGALLSRPSLMAFLLSALFRLTGPSFTEPRLLAVTAGSLAVAATFFLSRALTLSATAGVLAAVMVAVNGPSILASHVAVSGVFAPLTVALAGWATLRGLEGRPVLLVTGAVLWLLTLVETPWSPALLPGVALTLAGGIAPLPVARHPSVQRLSYGLAALLVLPLLILGRPVWPGHLYASLSALTAAAGDLPLVAAPAQPYVGAAVLAALVGSLLYGLRSRRSRVLAYPLAGALLGGTVLGTPASPSEEAVALLPLTAALAVQLVRFGIRRLSRRMPSGAYPAVAFLTALVVGFVPLFGLSSHYGRLLQADLQAPPSPQVLTALRRMGMPPQSHATVLLDSRGARAGVMGWVLAMRGYRVKFIGNPFASPRGSPFPGTSWTRDFLDPVGPSRAAAFVVTPDDFAVLMRAGSTAQVMGLVATHLEGGYVVGRVMPYPPPRAPVANGIVPGPGPNERSTGPGAGPGA